MVSEQMTKRKKRDRLRSFTLFEAQNKLLTESLYEVEEKIDELTDRLYLESLEGYTEPLTPPPIWEQNAIQEPSNPIPDPPWADWEEFIIEEDGKTPIRSRKRSRGAGAL